MGMNDWKKKQRENFTAEDDLCEAYDECPASPFCWRVRFIWKEFRYEIWEGWLVYKCQKEDKSNDNYLEEKKFDDFESMMLDPCWDGLSLSDMMSKIPYYNLF